MTVRKTRYWLYRLKNEALGGSKAIGAPRGFRRYWQNLNVDFKTFAVVWDVDPKNPERFIMRKKSVDEEWKETIMSEAKVLSSEEE